MRGEGTGVRKRRGGVGIEESREEGVGGGRGSVAGASLPCSSGHVFLEVWLLRVTPSAP